MSPRDAEAYTGELAMLRGVLGVVRVIAQHGDIDELRRVVAEHFADERAAYAELAEKDTREGESTPQPAGTCGRALSTGKPCPDHPMQQAEPFTDAHTAFMAIGHTPSLQGLRTELRIEGRPTLVGRYIGAGIRSHEGLRIIEPALVFEFAEPAEGEGRNA
ncbi:hypothetical protein [Streptomyces wuyuanensis]|uniref:hypothetical protein n=1 Tax=Streptomyces wuyuanensis TaxID=1196353 RepID=UPI0037B2C8D6